MAKIRAVKPETWTDDDLACATPFARLLFIGLWNFACDNGHLDDKPRQIKMRILPADDVDVEALLDELHGLGLIERRGGFVKVPNLPEHQRIDLRYLTLCDHCEGDESTAFTPSDHTGNTRRARRAPAEHTTGTRSVHAGRTRVHSTDGDGDGDGDGDKRLVARKLASDDAFETFWATYPRKTAKGQATKAYRAALKKTDADTILTGLTGHLPLWAQTEKQFIPHPATWLNGERWADDLDAGPSDDPYAHLPTSAQVRERRLS